MTSTISPPASADVAIIGAGPAGSTLAALLAARGIGVVLIDRDLFPRDKLCGEFLSYDALPIVDLLGLTAALDRAGAPHIARCLVAGSSRSYEFTFPYAARGVSRLLLDELLFGAAQERGAIPLDGWTAGAIDGNAVTITRDGESHTIVSKVIVGAWGRWGRFDAQLARVFVRDRTHRNFGFKRHYVARTPSASVRDSIELYSFGRGYLGVNAIEGGLTNICGLVHADRLAGNKGRWEGFVETVRGEAAHLDAMYARYEPAQDGFLSSEPVIFRAREPVTRGVIMLGDASGIIDPLTGNGMAMAMQSALLAAPHILRIVTNADARSEAERTYAQQHHEMFAHRIRWARRTAALLSRPALLDAALATLPHRAIGPFLLSRTRADRNAISRMAEAWTMKC